MTDTRWEELYDDIEPVITNMNYHNGGGCSITDVIEVMKAKGWKLSYPDDWPV